MNKKERMRKLLQKSKDFQVKQENQRLASEQELANQLNNVNNESKNTKGVNMKITKQMKHDFAILNVVGQMKAAERKSALSADEVQAMLNEYAEEKAIELTSDHTNILRTTQSSDMIFSFDDKSEAGSLLALFNRYDLPVNGKVQVPVDNQSVELQHLAETASVVEQTWDESLLTLETSRAALNFKLSRSLQFKSIVDQMKYVESLITNAVAKGLCEGIINGQGATTATQDNGYASTKMGTKMAGIRAKLSAAGYLSDAAKKEIDTTDGRALMQKLFDAAGARFSRSQAGYVILAARTEKLKISALVQGAGVSGVNQSAASSVYVDKYQGVPVIETGFLKSRTASSGSGYAETGFVSSTAADNDHGSLILIDPSQVWFHAGGERVDVEYKPATDSFDITLNMQAGWNLLVDAKNQPGVLMVNIGDDVA